MSDAIVPGYFCTRCNTGFPQNDPKKSWEKHDAMPLNGLNLRAGEVFGYGASSPIPKWSMVVASGALISPEDHRRSYVHYVIPIKNSLEEFPELRAASQFRAGYVYEFDPEQYALFLDSLKRMDRRFKEGLLGVMYHQISKSRGVQPEELLSLPSLFTRGTLSRE